MRITSAAAFAVVLLLPAAAMAGHELPSPAGTASPATAAGALTVWPYTASDFSDPDAPVPSDPVNLVILNTDPRAVRDALMRLGGARPSPPFPSVAPFDCRWSDAMGYEQAAYGEPEGWVGGAIQLACYTPGANPLGNPFRYHVRLFRIGEHTLAAAHFEMLIPNTAEHEVLSWNAARDFVVFDLTRAGASLSSPAAAKLFTPSNGAFRAVRRPVYDAVLGGGGGGILVYAGLPVPAPAGDVPIPSDGLAYIVAPGLVSAPVKYDVVTTIPAVQYAIDVPKPFCNAGGEYVHLEGSLELEMRVRTNRSGQYLRTYELGGTLKVTALTGVDAGRTFDAVISERHRAMLTDEYGQVTELASQLLLRKPPQLLGWVFAFGHQDAYLKETACGVN